MDFLKGKTVLLASGNAGKLVELRALTEPLGFQVISLKEMGLSGDAPETGVTFTENAIQKAEYYFEKTNMPVFSDDSGLEVDALGGAPGIHSARYGGFSSHAERRVFLLEQLKDVPNHLRTARFRCAAVFFDGQRTITADGKVEGYIGFAERGTGGFGYDPLFSRSWDGPTYAEICQEEKNQSSHRGRAFTELFRKLQSL